MSDKQKVDPECAADGHRAGEQPAGKKTRKQRTGDIGRALRSVYDETVRENVPNDFLDLLGKLQ